jgi:hypothetical protein
MAQQEFLRKRVITPEVILSYPHLFEPQTPPNSTKAKYSTAIVVPAGVDISDLKKTALEVGQSRWKNFPDGVRKGKFHWPFRDDAEDIEEKGYPEGSQFFNASSKKRPGVVSVVPDPATGKPMLVDDPERIYPGIIARVSVTFYTFDVSGNKGVGVGLNNVQIIRDGERLDGRLDPSDEFEADPNAVADLSDLEDETDGGSDDGEVADDGDDLTDLM